MSTTDTISDDVIQNRYEDHLKLDDVVGPFIGSAATVAPAPFSTAPAPDTSLDGGVAFVAPKPDSTAPAPVQWHDACYLLSIAADIVDDIEAAREGAASRRRSLIETKNAGPKDPPVLILDSIMAGLADVEKEAVKALEDEMKRHPLGPWIRSTRGLGMKSSGRLLAAVGGDPYLRHDDVIRTVGQLWSYCGFGDAAAQRKRKGHRMTWSPTARSCAYVVADALMKQTCAACVAHGKARRAQWRADGNSNLPPWAPPPEDCTCAEDCPYRHLYNQTRLHYEEAVHDNVCLGCGPKGEPATFGSPLDPAHKHARAIRRIAKQVLKDMWCEAKRLHDLDTSDGHLLGGTLNATAVAGVDPSPLGGQIECGTHHGPAAEGTPSDHVAGQVGRETQVIDAGDVVNPEAGAA